MMTNTSEEILTEGTKKEISRHGVSVDVRNVHVYEKEPNNANLLEEQIHANRAGRHRRGVQKRTLETVAICTLKHLKREFSKWRFRTFRCIRARTAYLEYLDGSNGGQFELKWKRRNDIRNVRCRGSTGIVFTSDPPMSVLKRGRGSRHPTRRGLALAIGTVGAPPKQVPDAHYHTLVHL